LCNSPFGCKAGDSGLSRGALALGMTKSHRDGGDRAMTTSIRHGAPTTPLTLLRSTPATAAGSLPRDRCSREQLLSVVGIGERMVAWVSQTAWTVLWMSGQEYVWGSYSVDDSALGDLASFNLALAYLRGSCSAADGYRPGGVAA
jgi:hypothetical protein